MKILSNYKDYYDYLAYQYGVDETVVFKRNRILPLPTDLAPVSLPVCASANETTNAVPVPAYSASGYTLTNWRYYERLEKICQFEFVSIAGTQYCYLYEYDRNKKSALMRIPAIADYLAYESWHEKNGNNPKFYFPWPAIWAGANSPFIGQIPPAIIPPDIDYPHLPLDRKLHEKLGSAILWKQLANPDGSRSLVMPNLSRITGFSGLCPATRIYQDICNFLQARRQTPDNAPPVALDNDSKILKHGFDLKKSFRKPGKSNNNIRKKFKSCKTQGQKS